MTVTEWCILAFGVSLLALLFWLDHRSRRREWLVRRVMAQVLGIQETPISSLGVRDAFFSRFGSAWSGVLAGAIETLDTEEAAQLRRILGVDRKGAGVT